MATVEIMGYIFGIILIIFVGFGIVTLLASFVEYVGELVAKIFSR